VDRANVRSRRRHRRATSAAVGVMRPTRW
jgi:hypothetical protein